MTPDRLSTVLDTIRWTPADLARARGKLAVCERE
jgi:hypothetical protein